MEVNPIPRLETPGKEAEPAPARTGSRPAFPDYLRVSVTDRCNFRCRYCMPPGSFQVIPHGEILRYEEILRVVAAAAPHGVRKVRLTGGEPLVRKDLPRLVEGLRRIRGVEELCLTTNGSLLGRFARILKDAGLDRVTVSLDSLRPDRFFEITGGGRLDDVLAGIEAARDAGLGPVKVNAVALKGTSEDEVADFARMAGRLGVEVRFIEYMPFSKESWSDHFLPADEIERILAAAFGQPLETATGTGPAARRLRFDGAGWIGLIAPISAPFCRRCDRLRLTSAGKLRACLIAGGELDLKALLRGGARDEAIVDLLRRSWAMKPEIHPVRAGAGLPHPLECQGMRGIGG